MKKTLAIAAALLVSACATVNPPAPTAAATPAAGTYYCFKDRLATEGDAYACNWERDARDVCHSIGSRTTLRKSAVASGPTDVRRCDNGQWVVMVTTR